MESKRPHMVFVKSKVLVDVSEPLSLERLKLMLTSALVSWPKMRLRPSMISWLIPLIITSQSGSWTDNVTPVVDNTLSWFLTLLIPNSVKISKECVEASNTEVSVTSGELRSEVKELNLLVDVEKPSVSRERSEPLNSLLSKYSRSWFAQISVPPGFLQIIRINASLLLLFFEWDCNYSKSSMISNS